MRSLEAILRHGLRDRGQRGAEEELPASGYCALLELIELSHTDERTKRRQRREAAVLFRSLRSAEVLAVERGRPARVRIDAELQRDFSLHHSLSLYLVEAIAALDTASETFAVDVLSLVEAILEDPRAILYQQERRAKDDLIAQLKAERVPYEERMNELEKVSWPKPNETFVRGTFELFRERHPWVRDADIHPKGIAREMAEGYSSFDDFVKRNQLARMEGLLLRYLSQVWNALEHNVPSAAMSEPLHDLASYLRATS